MSSILQKKAEILAPAGSVEQLVTAVNNGCDAVYLGLKYFNARMKAPNFNTDNIRYWINYCHFFDVKVYVAINTSIKNEEFTQACEALYVAYDNNADGVILTDLALIKIAGKLPKPFEVVASTQLSVHDKFGAEYLKKLGATMVVCARESSFDDIKEIVGTGIKAEAFIHGATCVCQSGQCLFSSVVGGNSGNRGLCAQPCRKRYTVDKGTMSGYFLSARDSCGLIEMDKLLELGVSSFKIEGRNRRPEYAGLCSRIYKNALKNGSTDYADDFESLSEMFNRGLHCNNYLYGKNSDIIFPSIQNHSGVYVGIVRKGGFQAEKPICKGDGLKVIADGKEVCGGIALESGNDCLIRSQFDGTVSNGMSVYRTTSVDLCSDVANRSLKKRVALYFCAFGGGKAVLRAKCGAITAEVVSDFVVQDALQRATNQAQITEQLQKIGNTHYTISDIDIKIGNIFLAKSQINELRRQVLQKLDNNIIADYDKRFVNRKIAKRIAPDRPADQRTVKNVCSVVCKSERELAELRESADGNVGYIVYKPETIDLSAVKLSSQYDAYLDLPSTADLNYIEALTRSFSVGFVCHNVGHVELARKLKLKYIAGSGLNIFNDYIAQEFSDADTFVYSLELSLKEISLFANKNGLIYVDGQLVLMKLFHCPYKVIYDCQCSACKCDNKLVYKDELGNAFKIMRRKDSRCSFELINGKKLSVVLKLTVGGRYLLDYDKKILQHYIALNNGYVDDYEEKEQYTKGRLYSKVN